MDKETYIVIKGIKYIPIKSDSRVCYTCALCELDLPHCSVLCTYMSELIGEDINCCKFKKE